ncbi:type II secretion system protein [Campylobacter curvus]|uniref:type II secretion system protein n=1 Tax=Campylobacter curvus TaxID=200 RepID=UPI0014707599|nr:type II secretion system protein [Campylobacter curvus]
MKNTMKKAAFTMIELVFVIVILGILAGVALPKLFFTRDDASLANARAQMIAVQSGISLAYNDSLLSGNPGYPANLGDNGASLFVGVTNLGVRDAGAGKNGWHKTGGNTYTLTLGRETANFTYDPTNGAFNCTSGSLCDKMQ